MAADFTAVFGQLRRRAGLTQEQIAQRCGFSVRTLRNLETGRHLPRLSTIELIVEGLDLDDKDAARLRAAAAGQRRRSVGRNDGLLIPHQLPADSRHFAGRQAELRWLDENTVAARAAAHTPALVVVCGAAGVGKTALAVRWAHSHAKAYPHGELFVDLRGFGVGPAVEPVESLARLLVQIGVQPRGATVDDLIAAWRSALDGRRVLLVLDNAASAEQVRPLLPASPNCCVVVTSRNALAGLVARDGAARLRLDVLPSDDSVRLLLSVIGARARDNLFGVRRLADACANLPLALRIAAELATTRPDVGLTELAERLGRDPLGELDTPDDPHNALRAVLMSSYKALPDSAAQSLRLLGVHPTPAFDRVTAAHLLGLSPDSTSTQLDLLVRAHMILALGDDAFAMHDLLYAFARELSEDDPAAGAAAFCRLVDHLLSAARTAVEVLDGPSQRWLADKRAVLVATAVQAGRSGRYEAAVEFAEILGAHLDATAAYADVLLLLQEATRAAERLDRKDQAAEAQRLIAVAHYRLGQPESAIAVAHRALTAFRALGDQRGEARCLMNIGSIRWRFGFGDDALTWYQQALQVYRAGADKAGTARALCNTGIVLNDKGHNDAAIRCYIEALTTFHQLGDRQSQSIALTNLGEVYLKLGQLQKAYDSQAQAAAIAHETRNRHNEGIALGNLGEISLRRGCVREARRYFVMALRAARDVGDRIGEGMALDNLGVVHRRRGDLHRAERAYHQSLRLAKETKNLDGQCAVTAHLAEVALDHHQLEAARQLAADAVLLALGTQAPARLAQTLNILAAIQERIGDNGSALDNRRRALVCARRAGDIAELATTLNGLASHHEHHGRERLAQAHRRYAATVLRVDEPPNDRSQSFGANRRR
ncbi:MAG TPA: tetratricopeptide repeat protein [Candidatus Limnocylindrales bacterium]|nr:tetratricopeptide repeat protein [Candidatus Limnocylindrales bacterium]